MTIAFAESDNGREHLIVSQRIDPDRSAAIPRRALSWHRTATPGGVFDAPVHRVRLPAPLPCGLNPLTLYAIAATLRHTHQPIDPVLVRARPGGDWDLIDGRHRLVAHWVAGRATIACREDPAGGDQP